jgi:hypothetical protein
MGFVGLVKHGLGQAWAGRMIDLLLNACHEVGAPLSETRLAFFLTRDAEILTEGELYRTRSQLRFL